MDLNLGSTSRKLDLDAIDKGVEKECPERPGLFVRILPASRYSKRFNAALENEALSVDGPRGLTQLLEDGEFVASVLVAGMRGIFDKDGKEVAYTDELGALILSNPAHRDVRDWVVAEAMQRGHYYTEAVESKKGNSASGSSGNGAGAARSRKTKS